MADDDTRDLEPSDIGGTAKVDRKKVVLGSEGQTQKLRQQIKGGADESTVDETATNPESETAANRKKMTLKLSGAAAAGSRQGDSQRMLRPKALAGDSTRMLRPKSLAGMTEEEKVRTQDLLPHEMDPSRKRETDTANLKRIRPGKTTVETGSSTSETATDTIHLRVIKEKKNQLKNILSASQTIRLRPSPNAGAGTASVDRSQIKLQPDSPGTAAIDRSAIKPISGDAKSKQTLKIKQPGDTAAPAPDETGTAAVHIKEKVAKTPESPNTAMVDRSQLKQNDATAAQGPGTAMVDRKALKADLARSAEEQANEGPGTAMVDRSQIAAQTPAASSSVGTGTVKLKKPAPGAPVQGSAPAAQAPSPPKPSAKSTLKIKAPATAPGVARTDDDGTSAESREEVKPAPASSGKATLKIKAPSSGTLKTKAPGAETSKQEAPSPSDAGAKTLKLKAAPKAPTLKTKPAPEGETVETEPAASPAPQAAPPQPETVMQPAVEEQPTTIQKPAVAKEEASIIVVLASVAAVLVTVGSLAINAMQFFKLY